NSLLIANHTGATAVLHRTDMGDAPDGKSDVTLAAGPGGRTVVVGTAPFSITFAEDGSKPVDLYPRTRLSLTCGSPQEDAEEKGEDGRGAAAPARPRKPLGPRAPADIM